MRDTFLRDVTKGLSSDPKTLPSRYFYDKKGDELFVRIMDLDEYYLTRAEHEIFSNKTADLAASLHVSKDQPFELVELGAGDGKKTKHLLKYLVSEAYSFTYVPVDISQNALDSLVESLAAEIPSLNMRPLQGDYFEVLTKLSSSVPPKKVLFLGSNIGNMPDTRANRFMQELSQVLSSGDRFLLGVDLIKNASIVLPAYDDRKGVTKAFNLNVLERINRQLGGNFNTDLFEHVVTYTEEEGIVRSYLKSKIRQKVTIAASGVTYEFEPGETIHTETSRKYDDALIRKLIAETPFQIIDKLTDSKDYFADYIFKRV